MDNISKANFNEIVDWFKHDKVFFLIGAGFSASSIQPSVGTGKQLAHYLLNSLDEELASYSERDFQSEVEATLNSGRSQKEILEFIMNYHSKLIQKNSINLKEVSDRIILRKGKNFFNNLLESYFRERDLNILDTHENIIPLINYREKEGLRGPLIVSLNIDTLIERAYAIYHKGYKTLDPFISGANSADLSRLNNKSIWKFHGCISSVDSIVFDSYSYYKVRQKKNDTLSEFKRLFRDKHCILLGVSLQDDHIMDLIYSLTEEGNIPQAVIVAPEKYLSQDFIDYMNQHISLGHIEEEISIFLKELGDIFSA